MSTYTPIASVILSSSQSSLTFSGIPQTYTDLFLVCQGKMVSGIINNNIRFNSDAGSNYSRTYMYGNGNGAYSGRTSNETFLAFPYWDATMNMTIIQIMNYSNTTTYKTALSRNSQPSGTTTTEVGLWRSTSAINSIQILRGGANDFASGSTFNLYGVANASITNIAKAAGGDTITTDGTYWYHTFLSSGTFTPTEALTADYLVVAGGGGAGTGTYYPGGGGAGGLRSTVTATGGGGTLENALSLTSGTSYTVTVGAGGGGGSNGSNSVFHTITSTGGGRGGNGNGDFPGQSGGSGGGGGNNAGVAGAGTANQGYAGGGYTGIAYVSSFGGGGAGATGGNTASSSGTPGGNGVAVSITGSSVTYAGGGGGAGVGGSSAGGAGGGGAGNGTSGTANTGGGGGTGGAGGSGIVIVRYPV
jgi:hypothetical protein